MNAFQLEKEYLEKHKNGMDFSELRKEMQSRDLSPQMIKVVIASIDKKMLMEARLKADNKKAKGLIFGGLFVVLLGLGIYIVKIEVSTIFHWYKIVLSGLGLALLGFAKLRKN